MANNSKGFMSQIKYPIIFLILIWAIHLSKYFLGFNYYGWGVFPRHAEGLMGIFTSPLIHGDFSHLINNSIPFFVVSLFMLSFYKKIAMKSFWLIYVLTGVMVWLFARPTFHIGASGVVYGMVAFLFWNGIFRRSVRAIAISLVVFFLYSGMIAGVFPVKQGVSWESHFLGGLVGVFVSYLFRDELEDGDQETKASWEIEPEEQNRYLDPDTFDLTLDQRRQLEARRRWEEDNIF